MKCELNDAGQYCDRSLQKCQTIRGHFCDRTGAGLAVELACLTDSPTAKRANWGSATESDRSGKNFDLVHDPLDAFDLGDRFLC